MEIKRLAFSMEAAPKQKKPPEVAFSIDAGNAYSGVTRSAAAARLSSALDLRPGAGLGI